MNNAPFVTDGGEFAGMHHLEPVCDFKKDEKRRWFFGLL